MRGTSKTQPKFCSECDRWHPVGVPCRICFVWKCETCGVKWAVSKMLRCMACGRQRPMTRYELRKYSHKETTLYCVKHKRKFRAKARDGNRTIGLKKPFSASKEQR